ncbi:peptidylprolyl isomerase [Halomonas alkalisoli]|uniref:peptidylprolyl isomerase n=1 Tax=Halomonas alkalisoli TaxID=2907158 RepID=UPI001F47EF61|nr:peptidylprolyl isomerase [Halomonas alkalisoli]MCE9682589.1 peptidylprolyl isomerase [Halomonas alkalisoli]
MMRVRNGYANALGAATLALLLVAAPAGAAREAPDPAATFATVNGTVITVGEYARALRHEARDSFYHGQPPEGGLARFQRRVADALVERELLATEARRRGLSPDAEAVEAGLARLAERGADAAALAAERGRLEARSLIDQLEAAVQAQPEPDPAAVRAFYDANPALFTEPAKLKLAVILLRVNPGEGGAAWQAAHDEAESILARLRDGADFAELAEIHSADGSAMDGGDLGYVHEGMLAPEIEAAARELTPGELAEPITVLEGVAVVRLEGRQAAQLRDFADVAERAAGLLAREQGEQALTALRETLLAEAEVTLRDELLEPAGGIGADPDER